MSEGAGSGPGPDAHGAGQEGAASGAAPSRVQLEYPLYYTFKALGLAGAVREKMVAHIRGVLGAAAVGEHAVSARPSSAGKYESISVQVYLASEEQRRRIYQAFHGDKAFVWYV